MLFAAFFETRNELLVLLAFDTPGVVNPAKCRKFDRKGGEGVAYKMTRKKGA